MSKQAFKSQMRQRSKLIRENESESLKPRVYTSPTEAQLYSFAVIYLESRMDVPLTELQKLIVRESFVDPEIVRMWQLRHLRFQEEIWTAEDLGEI